MFDATSNRSSSVITGPPRPPQEEIGLHRIKYYRVLKPIAMVAAIFSRPTALRGCGHLDEDDAGDLRPLPD
jgi:hypothetical protein